MFTLLRLKVAAVLMSLRWERRDREQNELRFQQPNNCRVSQQIANGHNASCGLVRPNRRQSIWASQIRQAPAKGDPPGGKAKASTGTHNLNGADLWEHFRLG
jgi:hypothetical protein